MDEDLRLKKTYAGVVEDNNDPKRLSRVKVRVFEVFSDIDTQDIPWASPWKDLNGENFILPEVGKIVTVVFENGDLYKPEYIYAEHFNINLENKLKSLSDSDYKSMKSLLFNHKTQIYVNDSEGLKIDHKFNNINIKDKSINVNLKDNFGKINIGDETANQEAVLGTNFFRWFDEFIDILSGKNSGPFLGNLAAPVAPTPALLASINKYKQLKQSKFLSKNVFLNDNYDISTVRQNREERENTSQIGDDYRSSETNINLKEFEFVDFIPNYGDGNEDIIADPNRTEEISKPDINKIINTMLEKGYALVEKPYYMNIIGVRNQYEGDSYTTEFKDEMWVIWKNDDNQWESKTFPFTSVPGWVMNKLNGGKFDDNSDSDNNVNYPVSNVNITIGDGGKLSDLTKDVISKAAQSSGNSTIFISSTQRPPESQVRAMLSNLERDWNSGDRTGSIQKEIYSRSGDIVIDVYVKLKTKGESIDTIRNAMIDKIIEIGPEKVSKHASDPRILNTMDIPYNRLQNKESFLSALKRDKRVDAVLVENNVYHVQVKQS